MKYRKKPVTIDAYQTNVELDIPTLEGTMHASIGDYIITGVRGEQYPCKPDIFLETYEPAENDNDATLGRETCHMEYCEEMSWDELYPTEAYKCSVCGSVTVEGKPNFCPNCGARVMEVTS